MAARLSVANVLFCVSVVFVCMGFRAMDLDEANDTD
jgi:hypothetical protein